MVLAKNFLLENWLWWEVSSSSSSCFQFQVLDEGNSREQRQRDWIRCHSCLYDRCTGCQAHLIENSLKQLLRTTIHLGSELDDSKSSRRCSMLNNVMCTSNWPEGSSYRFSGAWVGNLDPQGKKDTSGFAGHICPSIPRLARSPRQALLDLVPLHSAFRRWGHRRPQEPTNSHLDGRLCVRLSPEPGIWSRRRWRGSGTISSCHLHHRVTEYPTKVCTSLWSTLQTYPRLFFDALLFFDFFSSL